jgi:hypothetical protein
MNLSVVIIVCKSDAAGTLRTLQSLRLPGAELVLYDTSKTSIAKDLAGGFNARWVEGDWKGYEQVRYEASLVAANDWILMLHTGEELDRHLRISLLGLNYGNKQVAYRIRFKSLFNRKWLCHGEWGGHYHIRLANRMTVSAADQKISEALFRQQGITVQKLGGNILHRVLHDQPSLHGKLRRDARLAAIRYFRHGQHCTLLHLVISPLVAFFQNYLLKLGFLDGRQGYVCARLGAWYTFSKYNLLRKMYQDLKSHPETAKYAK